MNNEEWYAVANHKVYTAIVSAINCGKLVEPFTNMDFKNACPGLAERTYSNFLPKHRQGNPSNTSELFEQVDIDQKKYKLLYPIKYNLG